MAPGGYALIFICTPELMLSDFAQGRYEKVRKRTLAEIGKEEKRFIKSGAFSFDAVKFALLDKDSRIRNEPKKTPIPLLLEMTDKQTIL